MTYIAVLALVALLVTSLAYGQTVRSLIREHARERQLMLNQLMHLAGRTWQPPPSTETPPAEEYDFADERELLDPAQLPVEYS